MRGLGEASFALRAFPVEAHLAGGRAQRLFGNKAHTRCIPSGIDISLVGIFVCQFRVDKLDGSRQFLAIGGHVNVARGECRKIHEFIELHLNSCLVSMSLHHFGLAVLRDGNVHFELRRRHRQPFAVSG